MILINSTKMASCIIKLILVIVITLLLTIETKAAITITVDGSTVEPVVVTVGVSTTLDAVVSCPSGSYFYETWYYKNDNSNSCSGGTPVFISQNVVNSCNATPSTTFTWPSTGQKTLCYGYNACSGFLSQLQCIFALIFNVLDEVQSFRVDVGNATGQNIFLSTAATETLGGLTHTNGSIVEYNPITNIGTLFFDETLFSGNESFSGFHLLQNGNIILTSFNSATLGGLSFNDGDLIEYNPTTDTATLFFNENNFSGNENINAVYVKSNGNIVLSTTNNATLGGLTFNDGDLIEYNPTSSTATLLFSESNFSSNEDVDAVHILDSGNILISTTTPATLGGLTFDDGSIAEYNPATNTATLYFNENLFGSNSANITAHSLPVTVSSAIHHFEITHDGTALTCEPESITVKACTNSSCSSVASSDVSVTLIPTGWVSTDSQTITSGNSSFQLRKTTAGVYSLGIGSSTPTASNPVVCVNSTAGNASCDIEYYNTGFIYDVSTPQTACSTSSSITVSAVRTDITSQQCVPSFANRTESINFWTSYTSPTSGTKQLTVNNGSSNYTLATSSPGTAVPLTFNSSGQVVITVTYSDAGKLTLSSNFTGTGSESGLTMTGSDAFTTIPAKFYVYTSESNNACSSNSATCTAFKKAGANFNLNIRAACSDNSVTPNFVMNNIILTHDNTAPNVNEGSLSVGTFSMASGDSGDHTVSTQSVTEVGVFTFTATTPTITDSSNIYYGLTMNAGTSAYIGRFYPDHFTINSATVTNRSDISGCSDSFTYMDENLKYDFNLRAENSSNVLTLNYTSVFAKLSVTTLAQMNYGTTDSSSSYSSRTSVASSGSFTNGIAAVTAIVSLARQSSSEVPLTAFTTGINPTDSDSVVLASYNLALDGGSNTHGTLGATELRFGRGIINNAFGSEYVTLNVPWLTQYYVSAQTGFATNSSDNCSPLTTSLIDLVNSGSDPTQGVTSIAIGGGSSTASVSSNPVSSGNASLSFSAPSNSGYTDVGINFTTLDYLQFDWDSDGSHDDNPANARATFGSFRGDDRIIYWKELFN